MHRDIIFECICLFLKVWYGCYGNRKNDKVFMMEISVENEIFQKFNTQQRNYLR